MCSMLSKQGVGFTVTQRSTSSWKAKEYIYVLLKKPVSCPVWPIVVSHFLSIVYFPSGFPSHYCSLSSSLSTSILPALPLLILPPPSSLTPLLFYYPSPSSFFAPLPRLCLFNSVTVNHMSIPDIFFSLRASCRGILADSAPELHNARRESGRQASKCTNAPLKRSWLY